MRIPIHRSVVAVMVAAAAAACADTPTASPRVPGKPAAVLTPLSVSVGCVPYSGLTYDCTAQAAGGSGTYTFTWYGTVSVYSTSGTTSKAYTQCYKNYSSGYPSSGYLSVGVMVTDSDGNTASASGSRSC